MLVSENQGTLALKGDLKDHVLIGIDYETYYDTEKKYSLSKMTAEEYINSSLFQIIMCAIKINGDPAYVIDGKNFEEMAAHFRSLPWDKAVVYGHNGAFFDFLILSWVFGIVPAFFIDTLLLARPLAGTGQSNTLAALAERFGLPAKKTTIYQMNGVRREGMSAQLYNDYADYSGWDIELAHMLLPKLLSHWRPMDVAWMDTTMRMMAQPMFRLEGDVIAEGMVKEQEREGQQLERLLLDMHIAGLKVPESALAKVKKVPEPERELAAAKKMVGSSADFAELMQGFGIEPPLKWSEKKQDWSYAFARSDGEFMDLLDSDVPGAAACVEARLGVKSTIMASRLGRLEGIERRMGVLPIPIMPFAAHTGRNGGSQKVNVQNFSSRESASNPYGKANPCRRCICAPPGFKVYDADSSQIEVRVLGGVTGEPNILMPFSDKTNCPYCTFGTSIYGRVIVKGVDKFERNVSKSAVLGNGYGQGGPGFQAYCKRSGIILTLAEAQRIVDTYRQRHPYVTDFWEACEWALKRIMAGHTGTFGYKGCLSIGHESIILPSGRPIRYRGLRWVDRPDPRRGGMKRSMVFYDPVKRMLREVYGSLCCENVVQGAAADIIHEMGVILRWQYGLAPRLQVHDSLVFVEHEASRHDYVLKHVPHVMRTPRPWMDWIPLDMELEAGYNYGDLEQIKGI